MSLRGVGIDVADVARLARLLDAGGDRFAQRWFTADEIDQCDADPDPALAYATRFAAKEAVWKALSLSGRVAVPWRSIAVLQSAAREPFRVVLTGGTAVAAGRAGVGSVSVACSASGGVATAIALAEQLA